MLQKNIEKQQRKNRPMWTPYYTRVVRNRKAHTRKAKHKGSLFDY